VEKKQKDFCDLGLNGHSHSGPSRKSSWVLSSKKERTPFFPNHQHKADGRPAGRVLAVRDGAWLASWKQGHAPREADGEESPLEE
jgi:hypothetical protein